MSSMPIPERVYVPKNEEESGSQSVAKIRQGPFLCQFGQKCSKNWCRSITPSGSLLWAGVLLIVAESPA